jgi:hypothetical protein
MVVDGQITKNQFLTKSTTEGLRVTILSTIGIKSIFIMISDGYCTHTKIVHFFFRTITGIHIPILFNFSKSISDLTFSLEIFWHLYLRLKGPTIIRRLQILYICTECCQLIIY